MSDSVKSLTMPELKKFEGWLTERGAEILAPTNPYEVIRYRAGDETHVIYRKESGRWTAVNGSATALKAFLAGGQWKAPFKRVKRSGGAGKYYGALVRRDGVECFYCGLPVPEDEATLEHLVPVSHRGPNHLSNLALSHRACNEDAGNLSVVEKVKLRERKHFEASQP